MTTTDAEIIRRSQTEPRQFGMIFDRHFDKIHRYLSRRVGTSLADDLTAQTFTEAFDHRRRFDLDRSDASPWLYGIATNLVRRHRRTEERQLRAYARTGADPAFETDLEVVVDRLDSSSDGPRLAAALASLHQRDRDVLLLFAWGDHSYEDISYALGIPVGTVRSRLHRARRTMRELLEPNGQQKDDDTNVFIALEAQDG